MVNSHSLRRLSTASAPKIAKNAAPSSHYVILRMYYAQMVFFYKRFSTLFYWHTYKPFI